MTLQSTKPLPWRTVPALAPGIAQSFTVEQGWPTRLSRTHRSARSSPPLSDPKDVRAELDALRREVSRLAAELTDMRAHVALLETLAQEDPLTGLLNRRGFFRDLARAVAHRTRYGTNVAVLLADLDAFKPINDTYGLEAADTAEDALARADRAMYGRKLERSKLAR